MSNVSQMLLHEIADFFLDVIKVYKNDELNHELKGK
jgi:hypothetical protein